MAKRGCAWTQATAYPRRNALSWSTPAHEVGRDICRLFTGFAMLEFGEDAFTVERLDVAYAPEPAPVSL